MSTLGGMVPLHLSHKCGASRLGINSCVQLAAVPAQHWWDPAGRNSQTQSAVFFKLCFMRMSCQGFPCAQGKRVEPIRKPIYVWFCNDILTLSNELVFSHQMHTVKPVQSNHPLVQIEAVFVGRCFLFAGFIYMPRKRWLETKKKKKNHNYHKQWTIRERANVSLFFCLSTSWLPAKLFSLNVT